MTQQPTDKPRRPYWHVDLKWACGILALVALAVSLLFYNLSVFTERERATTWSATLVASMFSPDGLDDEKGLTDLRKQVAAFPGDTVAPFKQFPWLTVSKEQVLTLSPRELRIAIFSQITEPIYDKGLEEAAAGFTDKPAERKQFVEQAAVLGVFTRTTHDGLKQAFWIAAVLAALAMAAVVYFSAGWGRLVSPGVLLLLVSVPGALLGLLFRYPRSDGDSPFAALPQEITQGIGNSLLQSYGVMVVIGLVLLLAALVGRVVQAVRGRRTAVRS